ncbi:portal protein [Pseudoalteromonas sp.]|uniref:portal protein n=1 Tax=Pseudoalteromonas sp. TaxID=53249 RepID=UPI003564AF56
MPLKQDYSNISDVLIMIQKTQDAEQEQREQVREAKRFITVRDGMWDDYAVQKMDGRFRGTFNMCTPIIDGIAGEIEQSDFTLRVAPSGGASSKDTAKTLDGLIRNIRNISNAEDVFNSAGRSTVTGGFDAWEVVQDWVDGDTFDQDLFIRRVPNAVDSVWFDLSSVMQDRSDANWGVKLVSLPIDEYNARWPDGSAMSVGDNSDIRNGEYCNRKETVTVGKLYYRKPRKIELVRMTDGSVYKDDDDFKAVQDELAQAGITIELDEKGNEKRRTRESWRVYSRMFDGGEWLADEQETVFDYIPLIPVYGNFDIVDNQCVYFGKLQNLYDPQRVLNYALSRDIEDGALSPSPTIWMTDKMAEGNDYSQMNTDRAPIRIYNADPEAPNGIQFTGGPKPSAGLQTTIQNTQQMIASSSNTFQAQQGNANAQQSGIAGLQQIEQGNTGNIKWFKDLEVAICHTGKILINAIPRVYDATRQVRVLAEDGSSDIVTLNQTVFDQQSQQNITLNDLSVGEYDVVCEVGPAFNSAQKEAARSFEVMASINPEFAQSGMDIWLKNKKEPGMDLMAERFREQLFNAGLIPESQWTDEEEQKIAEQQAAAQNQPPQEDPMMVAARAEEGKAQAAQMEAQNKAQQTQIDAQIKMAGVQVDQEKIALEREKLQLDAQKFLKGQDDKFNVDAAKITQGQQKLDLEAQKLALHQQQQQIENALKMQQQQQQEISDAINNLKVLREAIGADSIVGDGNTEAYAKQAEIVKSKQEAEE